MKISNLERFMKRVKVDGECWNWTGAKMPRGYGRFYLSGKRVYAHRAILIMRGVSVPADKLVLHSCDNPSCVRPEHLSVGTQTDNMRDASRKGRIVNVNDWRGDRNPKAKLNDSERAEIARLYRSGVSSLALSKHFNVTTTRVWQLAKGRA